MHANDDLAQLKKHYGMEHKERQNQNTRRGNPYMGFLWGILIVLLLNGLVFPSFNGRRIVETDYGTFIGKVDSGCPRHSRSEASDISIKTKSLTFRSSARILRISIKRHDNCLSEIYEIMHIFQHDMATTMKTQPIIFAATIKTYI